MKRMLERITKETFDDIYPIFEEAFPVEELREKERQKTLLDKPQYRLYGIKNESEYGVLQGAVAMWDFNDFIYIEHFAIKPIHRNGGFGGKKLKEMIAWVGRPVVLEVEVPTDEMTKRRVGFYERHGFFFNDYPYLQPPMRVGQKMLPLRLMTIPEKISEEVYERYKRTIHKIVYNFEEE